MTPTIHPELQALMHHLTPEARAQLEANLLADGVRDPLVVWQEEGVLLDGHNRLQVCTQHDLPYSVYEISLPSLNAAKLWVLANQLGRRNNTPEQTSYYLGKQYQLQKQMGFKGNQHTRADGNGYQKQTAAQGLAAQHKVAEKTIRNHDAYAKAIDTLSDTIDPAIGPAVLAREITLTQQDVRTLAKIAETDTWTTRHALDRVKHASTPKQVRAVVREAAREARQHQQELQKVADSHITGEIPEADWPERIKRKYGVRDEARERRDAEAAARRRRHDVEKALETLMRLEREYGRETVMTEVITVFRPQDAAPTFDVLLRQGYVAVKLTDDQAAILRAIAAAPDGLTADDAGAVLGGHRLVASKPLEQLKALQQIVQQGKKYLVRAKNTP